MLRALPEESVGRFGARPVCTVRDHPASGSALPERAAAAGNDEARELVSYFVDQGVGLVEQVRSSRQVVQDFREEFLAAVTGLAASVGIE